MKHVALPPHLRQRGAATLIVVMMLFLVMALLAAYANRHLMFEQRMAGSYYRASMAQEMSEGGLDWTVAMLNGTAIDASCQQAPTGGTRFIDRYVTVSAADRSMQTPAVSSTAALAIVVDCASTPTGLVCRCPVRGTRTAQTPVSESGALVPSVGIAIGTDYPNAHFGSFVLRSTGCTTSSVDTCAGVQALSQTAVAVSQQSAAVALVGAVPSSPASPLTVKGTLTTTGSGGLGLHNTDARSAGTLVVSGGIAPALDETRMDSLPGTPAAQSRIFQDPSLATGTTQADRDKLFQTFLGIKPRTYRNHPALRMLQCTPGGDCGPALTSAYNAGQRIVWVQGDMTISSNINVGTPANPMLVIVDGNVTLTGPMNFAGMLVAQGNLGWTNTTGLASLITGSVLVTGNMAAEGRMDIQYLSDVADQLRNRIGSYARISGSWMDVDTN